ncbi:MAG: 4,5-DOPA dioxygenase extradiol, partial [Bacteroidetes bacterium]
MLAGSIFALSGLQAMRRQLEALEGSGERMPVLFLGHGSPMNAIEDNDFTRALRQWGEQLLRPKAILMVSAHWLTRGTHVLTAEKPRTIHDMYGFPDEVYRIQYPAPGAPEWAAEVQQMVRTTQVLPDESWGFDHGTWSVLKWLFPRADVPVFQLSIDYYQPYEFHWRLAQELRDLRQRGVLIVGSGNLTHNLRMVDF